MPALLLFAALAAAIVAEAAPIPAPRDVFHNLGSECGKVIALPEPTGPHQVGTSVFHFVDTSRPEEATATPHDRRQVVFQLWYPALRDRDSAPVAYVPELEAIRAAFMTDSRETPRNIADSLEAYGCVLTHAFADLPASDLQSRYPVIVFSPGGNMSRHWHTAQAQEFASNGYVVAVLSHAYSGLDLFPGIPVIAPERWQLADDATAEEEAALDNAMSEELALDARFALSRLEEIASGRIEHPLNGRLDLSKVAIAGHSRGGKTVARACSTDARFKACVTYDNVAPDRERTTGLDVPQLTVRAAWREKRTQALRDYLDRNDSYAAEVEIAGANHFSFTDLQIVDPANYEHELEPETALELSNAVVLRFLDDALAGRTPDLTGFVNADEIDLWTNGES